MSRKLIIYDNLFNDFGLQAIEECFDKKDEIEIQNKLFAEKGIPLYDSTIQQLFESLLATPVILNSCSGFLQKAKFDSSTVHSHSIDWFAIIPLEDLDVDNSLSLFVDQDGKTNNEIDNITKEINSKYVDFITTKKDKHDFNKNISVPLQKNNMILIKADLWHSIDIKDGAKIITYFIKKGDYAVSC